jgi:hypothetical protein
VMWIASPEQLRYLAAAVLLLCPAAPPTVCRFGRAGQAAQRVPCSGHGQTEFGDLAPVADLSPCIGGKLPADPVG